jgi:hypothetical protein
MILIESKQELTFPCINKRIVIKFSNFSILIIIILCVRIKNY